jgi:hypothetical protein
MAQKGILSMNVAAGMGTPCNKMAALPVPHTGTQSYVRGKTQYLLIIAS